MSKQTAPQENTPIVTDRRRLIGPGEIVTAHPIDKRWLRVGEFYEIHGVCWYVRKVTKHDVILRRFTGTMIVNKADATPQQIKGARRA